MDHLIIAQSATAMVSVTQAPAQSGILSWLQQMSPLAWVNAIIVIVGIPTMATMLINIGGKLKTLETIDDDITDVIKPDLKDVRERFGAVETKVETLWQAKFAPGVGASASPYRPTSVGNELLSGSTLKTIIDESWATITAAIRGEAVGGKDTPLDIENIALRYLERMIQAESYKPVRNYASMHPAHGLSVILLVGSWYIRGKYLNEDWISR